jgi:hypothetical protein
LNTTLESLSNILIAAVLKKAGNDDKKMVDPNIWEAGFNALIALFCSQYSRSTTTYSDKVIGSEAVKKVISIGFDVAGEPSGALKEMIQKYLAQQGNIVDNMNYGGSESSPYILLGFSNFLKDAAHYCSFRAFFTTFSTTTSKISKTCKDDKMQFDFNFTITHCSAEFMLANWETNPTFKQRVADFIATHQPGSDFFDDFTTARKFDV